MQKRWMLPVGLSATAFLIIFTLIIPAREKAGKKAHKIQDAVEDAQTPRDVARERPEQQKSDHDRSDIFSAGKAQTSSDAFEDQPEQGKIKGFDFYRDPLNAEKPMQTFAEIRKMDIAAKKKVMETQRKLLESRYRLKPRLDPTAKMSRGKPLAVGPTARLSQGMDWEALA